MGILQQAVRRRKGRRMGEPQPQDHQLHRIGPLPGRGLLREGRPLDELPPEAPLAASLLDIEPRLRRIKGYRHLPRLREALQREMKIENERKTSREAA